LNKFVGDGDGSARHGSVADSLGGLGWPAENVRSFYEGLLEG